MGIMRVQLPEDLRSVIDRRVTEGRVASEADYVATALRLYADHLDAEDEIAAIVERADADLAAGRQVMVATPEDGEALHDAAMSRLRARLAADDSGR